MHFTCRSFIGPTRNGSWSQFWENEPDDPVLISLRGHLFGLVTLAASADLDLSASGHDLITQINEKYFSTGSDDPVARLKNVLEDISLDTTLPFTSIQITLSVVLGDHLFIAILNGGRCFLLRQSRISPLLQGKDAQIVSISGKVIDADRLFFCTTEFFDLFTWEKIKSHLLTPKIQDLEENFLTELYSTTDQPHLAAVFIETLQDDSPETIVEDIPPELIIPPVSLAPAPTAPRSPSLLRKILSHRPVYVSHRENVNLTHRRKINIIFSLLVLAALFVSAFIGRQRNQVRQTEENYQKLKSEVNSQIANATSVKNLSLETALNLAKSANNTLDAMSKLKIHPDEITALRGQTQALLAQTGSSDSFSPEIFYDTSILVSNPHYSQLYLTNNLLYLLDTASGRIDELDVTQRSTKVVSSTLELQSAVSLAANNGSVYVLKNKQLFLAEKDKLTTKIDLSAQLPDPGLGQIHFWNGSLYLLSLSASPPTIWKFASDTTGFLPGAVWLKDQETLPDSPVSFAINGDVWVMGSNGTIIPYTHGNHQTFKTPTASFSAANHLVTSVDSDLLAFTDKENLIYVYHKDGQSPRLYNLGKRQVASLALDAARQVLLVLCTDQKIYKINL